MEIIGKTVDGLSHAANCIDDMRKKAQELADDLSKHPAFPILESVKVGADK